MNAASSDKRGPRMWYEEGYTPPARASRGDSAGYCPRCGGDARNPVADCPTCNGFAATDDRSERMTTDEGSLLGDPRRLAGGADASASGGRERGQDERRREAAERGGSQAGRVDGVEPADRARADDAGLRRDPARVATAARRLRLRADLARRAGVFFYSLPRAVQDALAGLAGELEEIADEIDPRHTRSSAVGSVPDTKEGTDGGRASGGGGGL